MTRLADDIDYQPDAIVSKVLAKSKGGNVTLFAFAAGQELSEHTSPFEALILGVEGTGEIGIGGAHHRLTGGDLLRLPPSVPHRVKAVEPFKMLLILLKDGNAAR
ncbi:MAG TPA: cupin domain-containing protein [Gemmatimonadales bacterium]